MKDLLALIGAIVLCMAVAGSLGIGHFRLYYTDHKTVCVKEAV